MWEDSDQDRSGGSVVPRLESVNTKALTMARAPIGFPREKFNNF